MKSPINGKSEATLEKKISVKSILKVYQDEYGIDVKRYFRDLDHIEIYRCNDTGYRFYYPFDIWGDSDFYIHFQQFDWYYMSWKWEHEASLEFIKPGDYILEVGAGKGAFLKQLSQKIEVKSIGLELNESAAFESEKISIINRTVEDFSKTHKDEFNVVCSYQVLEHISSIHTFLNASIESLHPGGKLIICVPNNNSFLKYDVVGLNSPPHHMGLWDEKSLAALQNYFPIKLTKMLFEPLQTYHAGGQLNAIIRDKIGEMPAKIVQKVLRSAGVQKTIEKSILNKANKTIGQSVMAVFEKI